MMAMLAKLLEALLQALELDQLRWHARLVTGLWAFGGGFWCGHDLELWVLVEVPAAPVVVPEDRFWRAEQSLSGHRRVGAAPATEGRMSDEEQMTSR
jgi:hypothetical protein